MIDFTVPPELEAVRTRVAKFVADEVLPAEARALRNETESGEPAMKVVEELRAKARAAKLWTPHLPQEWGGLGLGVFGMALVSQELGVSPLGPLALNCSAPDEGNMHALLTFGTPEQKERYLRPLADARVRSCFAMTERAAGADAAALQTRATREGAGWRLDGEKWFITGAEGAAFALTVAKTGADSFSLFLVDLPNPGWHHVRSIPTMGTHAPGGHGEIRLDGVRVAADALLGPEGQGFAIAQHRLGLGRINHAMRWIGVAQRALDLAAARATSREAFDGPLAEKQAVQWMLADSATDLYASRLMVLHAAWKIDKGVEHRQEIAMLKVFVANALHRIVDRAIQIHGALGYSDDTPLARFYRDARAARIYDGPDEVHQMVIARNVLRASRKEGGTKSATGGLA
ncbi:MAG: acyl-CoA dehydrogenase family protein [Thermoplasmatota archaeon]